MKKEELIERLKYFEIENKKLLDELIECYHVHFSIDNLPLKEDEILFMRLTTNDDLFSKGIINDLFTPKKIFINNIKYIKEE